MTGRSVPNGRHDPLIGIKGFPNFARGDGPNLFRSAKYKRKTVTIEYWIRTYRGKPELREPLDIVASTFNRHTLDMV